jgi:hypothetical protein
MTGADGIGPQRWRAAMAAVVLALLLLTGACASPFERPAPFDDELLRARAVTKTDDGIRVSAAVPSADESRSIFGVDLDQRGIQPLWLEIENGSERSVYFLPTGLDPEYFAPLEVAFLYGGPFHDEGKAALSEHLEALSFDSRSPIAPGETVTGFVYVNRADPSMMVNVDLIGREWSDSIGLVVPVPGTEAAQQRMAALRGLYTESDVVEIDDEPALRRAALLRGRPNRSPKPAAQSGGDRQARRMGSGLRRAKLSLCSCQPMACLRADAGSFRA